MVLADLEVLGDDAREFVRRVRCDYPEMPIVITSEQRSVATAVEAMRSGCEDFLLKPLDRKQLEGLLETRLPNRHTPVAAGCEDLPGHYKIVGRNPGFLHMLQTAAKVAPTSMPVLITGESGTGKELISYLIHSRSKRNIGPYVHVNCAAMSESLLESELFGHERGAFTGAVRQRKGLFERAHGGTLLLDEISETSVRLQAGLLRVLEQQDFERVGGTESVRVDVRVISTSNRDLAAAVEKGKFRRDLYYRLSGLHLLVPPLRKRPEDVPPLVWHFVNQYARETRRRIAAIDPETMDRLCKHSWPGNVRQLRNVVRTALAMGEGEMLVLEDPRALPGEPASSAEPDTTTLSLRDLERRAILEALRRTKSHHAKAAGLLGITDRTLREKLRRYRRDGVLEQPANAAPSFAQPAPGENRWLMETA